jgi:hypothetical protein
MLSTFWSTIAIRSSPYVRDRREVYTADLLEIRELADLQPIKHHLPADAPGAEGRRLPVVFFKTNVVLARIDPHRLETLQIDLLYFVGRGLQDHLELMELEDAVRILAEAPVCRPARRLHVRDVPRFRPERPQQRFRMRRARTDLEVERLLNDASLRRPESGKF